MNIKQIELTPEERKELKKFSTTGTHSIKLANRAKIILALDVSTGKNNSQTQGAISRCIGVSRQTIYHARDDFLAAGSVSAFLQRKKRKTPPVPPKITGELEARIIALACSKAPQGFARWSLRLLAEKCIELQFIDEISHMTIKRLLKKHSLSLI